MWIHHTRILVVIKVVTDRQNTHTHVHAHTHTHTIYVDGLLSACITQTCINQDLKILVKFPWMIHTQSV